MKRVLNSGTIKLPQVTGTEKTVIHRLNCLDNDWSTDEIINIICKTFPEYIREVKFKFEIKAPLLTYLTFQDSILGTLKRLPELDHPIAYLPPQFFKKDELGYNIIDHKQSNVYNTKLYNFYSAALNFYNNLIKDGMCKEQASLILPQGMLINFLWEVNAKDLMTFIEKNYNKSPELFGYSSTFVIYLEEHLPLITKWMKANKWQDISL